MKIHYSPTVYLVNKPDVHVEGFQQFLKDHDVPNWMSSATNDGDFLAEVAGRVCYMSFEKPRPGGNSAYLDNIKQQRHGSVTEHPSWTFIFTGISRTCTHELVRHRAGFAYSQLSQRYVDESVCEVVCPLDLKAEVVAAEEYFAWAEGYVETSNEDVPEKVEQEYLKNHPQHTLEMLSVGRDWINGMRKANKDYQELVSHLSNRIHEEGYQSFLAHPANAGTTKDAWWASRPQDYKTGARKQARQAARSVLPNATETKIVTTANARAWRHFLEMRASRHAEPEIRMLSFKVWEVLVKEAPNLFGDYVQNKLPDGTTELTTQHKKV